MERFVYRVEAGDIEHGGSVSTRVKSELQNRGFSENITRRAGIVVFEGEMNLLLYAGKGGTVQVMVFPQMLEIMVEDDGPGIEDIDLALTPGYSTAPDWAIELGFGAGMGLVNMRSQCDQFEIHSHPGEGTRIRCVIQKEEECD